MTIRGLPQRTSLRFVLHQDIDGLWRAAATGGSRADAHRESGPSRIINGNRAGVVRRAGDRQGPSSSRCSVTQ